MTTYKMPMLLSGVYKAKRQTHLMTENKKKKMYHQRRIQSPLAYYETAQCIKLVRAVLA